MHLRFSSEIRHLVLFVAVYGFAYGSAAIPMDCRDLPKSMYMKTVFTPKESDDVSFSMTFEGYQWAACEHNFGKYTISLHNAEYSLATAKWKSKDDVDFEKNIQWLEMNPRENLEARYPQIDVSRFSFALFITGMNGPEAKPWEKSQWHTWYLFFGDGPEGLLVHDVSPPGFAMPNSVSRGVMKAYTVQIIR